MVADIYQVVIRQTISFFSFIKQIYARNMQSIPIAKTAEYICHWAYKMHLSFYFKWNRHDRILCNAVYIQQF